jgi:hypothetical protein
MNHDLVVNKIKSTVIRDFPSAKIIQFGSRSRGTAGQSANWDVLIIINEGISEKEKIELHNKIFEIELACGEIINAIIHTRQEWKYPLMKSTPFFQNVVKEGIAA